MKDKDRYWDCLDQAMEASSGGRTDEALAWLDEALKVEPNGAEAHNSRGEILWEEGRCEDALYEFELAAKADPKYVVARLNRAEVLIEDMGETELALEQLDEMLAGGADQPRLDRASEAEIHYLKARALFLDDDLEGALFLVRRALQTGGDQGTFRGFEGQILFELGRFEEARRQLEIALAIDPDYSHAVYHLGLTLERLGDDEGAAKCFEKAAALAPDVHSVPCELGEEELRKIASETLDDLPRSIRRYVQDVPVLIEDFPSDEMISRENVSPQILGIFIGTPRTQEAVTAQPEDVTRVILFRRNLAKLRSEELEEEIMKTVKHEIGHYLGFDEEALERLGLA
ncbi:MAG TPA: tetratricopeptide repeat protein [Myxococcota bacterium]|jgi:predicted Zn-dependent protease with MMP-like domain|nr:tetratricopeptide repeat protein [Myxococcota bacterium]